MGLRNSESYLFVLFTKNINVSKRLQISSKGLLYSRLQHVQI